MEWIRTGKEAQTLFNNMLHEVTDGKIEISGVEQVIEGIAQDRAVTLLVKHFNIDLELANEIYNEHYKNKES